MADIDEKVQRFKLANLLVDQYYASQEPATSSRLREVIAKTYANALRDTENISDIDLRMHFNRLKEVADAASFTQVGHGMYNNTLKAAWDNAQAAATEYANDPITATVKHTILPMMTPALMTHIDPSYPIKTAQNFAAGVVDAAVIKPVNMVVREIGFPTDAERHRLAAIYDLPHQQRIEALQGVVATDTATMFAADLALSPLNVLKTAKGATQSVYTSAKGAINLPAPASQMPALAGAGADMAMPRQTSLLTSGVMAMAGRAPISSQAKGYADQLLNGGTEDVGLVNKLTPRDRYLAANDVTRNQLYKNGFNKVTFFSLGGENSTGLAGEVRLIFAQRIEGTPQFFVAKNELTNNPVILPVSHQQALEAFIRAQPVSEGVVVWSDRLSQTAQSIFSAAVERSAWTDSGFRSTAKDLANTSPPPVRGFDHQFFGQYELDRLAMPISPISDASLSGVRVTPVRLPSNMAWLQQQFMAAPSGQPLRFTSLPATNDLKQLAPRADRQAEHTLQLPQGTQMQGVLLNPAYKLGSLGSQRLLVTVTPEQTPQFWLAHSEFTNQVRYEPIERHEALKMAVSGLREQILSADITLANSTQAQVVNFARVGRMQLTNASQVRWLAQAAEALPVETPIFTLSGLEIRAKTFITQVVQGNNGYLSRLQGLQNDANSALTAPQASEQLTRFADQLVVSQMRLPLGTEIERYPINNIPITHSSPSAPSDMLLLIKHPDGKNRFVHAYGEFTDQLKLMPLTDQARGDLTSIANTLSRVRLGYPEDTQIERFPVQGSVPLGSAQAATRQILVATLPDGSLDVADAKNELSPSEVIYSDVEPEAVWRSLQVYSKGAAADPLRVATVQGKISDWVLQELGKLNTSAEPHR